MTHILTQQQREAEAELPTENSEAHEEPIQFRASGKGFTERLEVLWEQRRLLFRVSAIGFAAAVLIAFLVPKRYTTNARLMPPDTQSASSMMMLAGLAQKAGGGLGAVDAGSLAGPISSCPFMFSRGFIAACSLNACRRHSMPAI